MSVVNTGGWQDMANEKNRLEPLGMEHGLGQYVLPFLEDMTTVGYQSGLDLFKHQRTWQ